MPHAKMTKAAVEKLMEEKPSGAQRLVWDRDHPGFGVRVSAVTRGDVAFIAQGRVRGGPKRRVTISPVADWFAGGRTIDDARAEAARLRLAMLEGRDPKGRAADGMTLRQALDDYLVAAVNLAPRSSAGYRSTTERYFKAWLDRPLREVEDDELEKRYRAIASEAGAPRGRSKKKRRPRPEAFVSAPGAATANAALRVLRLLWHHAAERDQTLRPWPSRRFRKLWHSVGRRRRAVKQDDLAAFWAALDAQDAKGEHVVGRGARDLIALLLFTGLRYSEAATLRWGAIDFAAGVIRFPAEETKSRRPLDLPMSSLVLELLEARRELGADLSGHVFEGRGRDGHPKETRRAFASIARRSGLPRVSPHDLRRTFVTITDNASGVSPLQARALVNHAVDVGDVHEGYVVGVELRAAAEAVAGRLRELCGIPASKSKKKGQRRAA